MVDHNGAGLLRRYHVRERESSVVGRSVVVTGAANQVLAAKRRLLTRDLFRREQTVTLHVAEHGQRVVHEQADSELPQRNSRALIHGPREPEWPHEVRGDAEEGASLAARLEYEMEMPMLEIANAAVNEARRPAGRSAREVVSLHERRLETAHRGVAGDAGSGDAAPDDEDVELLLSKSRQSLA